MFTGIIETTAKVVKIEKENTNYHFTLEVPFGDELAIGVAIRSGRKWLLPHGGEGGQRK